MSVVYISIIHQDFWLYESVGNIFVVDIIHKLHYKISSVRGTSTGGVHFEGSSNSNK